MIAPGLIDLMNLAIDGVATPRQRADLDAALAAQPEARAHYESLARMVEKLNADPMPEPPAELEPRILDALEHARMRRPAPVVPVRRGFFSFTLRPWSTFALGVAAGALVLTAIQIGRPGVWNAAHNIDSGSVSGSMVSEDREVVASIPLETKDGTASGTASIYEQDGNMVVRVQLQSTVPVEWHLDFDGDAWSLLRVERQGTATGSFSADHSSVQGMHTGEGSLTLVFSGSRDAAQALVMKLLEDGQPVFEGRPTPAR